MIISNAGKLFYTKYQRIQPIASHNTVALQLSGFVDSCKIFTQGLSTMTNSFGELGSLHVILWVSICKPKIFNDISHLLLFNCDYADSWVYTIISACYLAVLCEINFGEIVHSIHDHNIQLLGRVFVTVFSLRFVNCFGSISIVRAVPPYFRYPIS